MSSFLVRNATRPGHTTRLSKMSKIIQSIPVRKLLRYTVASALCVCSIMLFTSVFKSETPTSARRRMALSDAHSAFKDACTKVDRLTYEKNWYDGGRSPIIPPGVQAAFDAIPQKNQLHCLDCDIKETNAEIERLEWILGARTTIQIQKLRNVLVLLRNLRFRVVMDSDAHRAFKAACINVATPLKYDYYSVVIPPGVQAAFDAIPAEHRLMILEVDYAVAWRNATRFGEAVANKHDPDYPGPEGIPDQARLAMWQDLKKHNYYVKAILGRLRSVDLHNWTVEQSKKRKIDWSKLFEYP